MKDIARAANVSCATVSRALSGKPGTCKETREYIKALAKEMNYTPNSIARGLVTKCTKTLGFVVADITNPFFSELAQGFEEQASKNGYGVFLCNTGWDLEKEKKYLKNLLSNRVDGIAIAPVSDEISHIMEIDKDIPTVFAAYRPHVKESSFVATDDSKSATMAVEYLIKIGHRRIAYIGGQANKNTNIDRFNGYRTTMEKHQIRIDNNYIANGEFSMSSGYNLAKKLLIHQEPPTAIVAGDDLIALGVIQAIEEFGLSVPQNISVLGFDDISYASLYKIRLTTVRQPIRMIGEVCMDIILKKLKDPEENYHVRKIMNSELIIRKTCRGI